MPVRRPFGGRWFDEATVPRQMIEDSRAQRGQGERLDFSLSAEQQELKAAAVDFARRELDQDLAEREEAGEFSPEAWRACAKFGIQGLPVPAELGGGGADILTTVLVMEALGYGCHDNGLIFSLNAQMWSLELPLVKFGTPAQQQAYLPGLISGDLIGVHAMTEPDSGSDAFSMRTRVERAGRRLPAQRDQAVHHQRPGRRRGAGLRRATPASPRWRGISAFLVEKGTPGFTVTRGLDKMGLRTSPMGEVVLDDCVVPAANRLGSEGAGMAIFNSSMTWERSCILASALGAMQRQLEACVEYARVTQAVRPAHRQVPGRGGQGGRHVPAAGGRPAAGLPGRVARPAGQVGPGRGGRGQAVRQRGVGRLQPGRDPGPRRLRLHEGKRHRARPAGRRRQHHLLRYLRDPAGHPGPDAGPLSPCEQGEESRSTMAYLLQHLLTDSAARAPRRPAVAVGERTLTYAELDKLSNQVARALLAQGVAPGDRVGILAPKSAASVVALFGVLKAGACYVPLDPKSPAARLATIMADSGITVVLADQATAHQAAAMAGSVPRLRTVIVTGPHWGREATAGPEPGTTSPGPAVVPWDAVLAEPGRGRWAPDLAIETDLAYILYTSGSTGTPKGVMISHRASLTFVEWAAACAGLASRTGSAARPRCISTCRSLTSSPACKAAACLVVVPEKTSHLPRAARAVAGAGADLRLVLGALGSHDARDLRQPAGSPTCPGCGRSSSPARCSRPST